MLSVPGINSDPFLKYPGGKRGLLARYKPYFPSLTIGRYLEPMVGGGALLFSWSSGWVGGATICDINQDLLNAYKEVKRDSYIVASQLAGLIKAYNSYNDKRGFYDGVRANFNFGERSAANFIFLNRTGFNGLVRYNRRGEFNVSWGKRDSVSLGVCELVKAAGRILARPNILVREAEDFSWVLTEARRGDLVFFDPPYLSQSGFVDYYHTGFSLGDHMRLAQVARELCSRGVIVRIANAGSVEAVELYSGFDIVEVQARRPINSDSSGRGLVPEILVCGGGDGVKTFGGK